MKNKKLISLALAIIMVFALAVPVLAEFSDLKGHWAEKHMIDLANRGLLKGFSDGTMRPDADITGSETLVLLSRFYELDRKTIDNIYDTYESVVKKNVPSSLSWAYEEIAICLAAGICTESELKNLDLSKPIKKELLSVFVVRAMFLEDKALAITDTEMDFGDYSKISKDYRGHVKFLTNNKIIQGDDKGNFGPQQPVTRAMVATIASRSLDYIKDNKLDLDISGYEPEPPAPDYTTYSNMKGIIRSYSSSTLELRSLDGITRSFKINEELKVKVNGSESTLSNTLAGSEATVYIDEEKKLTAVEVTKKADESFSQGTITSVRSSKETEITVKDPDTSVNSYHTIASASSVKVTLDGKSSSVSNLKSGQYVTVRLLDDDVKEIYAYTEAKITGTIKSINFAATTVLTIFDGTAECILPMSVNNLPKILRGRQEISIDRLNPGEEVTVTLNGSKVVLIESSGNESRLTGTISSISTNAEGTTWVIITDLGDTRTLTVSPNVTAWYGNKQISISNINVGDKVTAITYIDTVVEVTVDEQVSTSTKLNGTVLTVDEDEKEITIVSGGKMIRIDVSSNPTIILASTGESYRLWDIRSDSKITAYGNYTTGNLFRATSIVVEDQ